MYKKYPDTFSKPVENDGETGDKVPGNNNVSIFSRTIASTNLLNIRHAGFRVLQNTTITAKIYTENPVN